MNRDNDTLWKMAVTQLHAEKYNSDSEHYKAHVHKRLMILKESKAFSTRMIELSRAKPHTGETLATGFRK